MLIITTFDEIYCLNHLVKQDKRLSKFPIYKYYDICWGYLQFAISYFQYDCLPSVGSTIPKVLDYSPYQKEFYEFIGNGTDNQFLLEPTPPDNCLLYVAYKESSDGEYIELNNSQFSYDTDLYILTVNISPELIYELFVCTYIVGQFNGDLDFREKNILAEGMLVPYLEETTNDYMTRKQMIYNDSSRIHSQANHQDANVAGEKHRINVVDKLITDYSYRSNRENYIGLSGIKTLGGMLK